MTTKECVTKYINEASKVCMKCGEHFSGDNIIYLAHLMKAVLREIEQNEEHFEMQEFVDEIQNDEIK